jgi:mRNA interferase HigB
MTETHFPMAILETTYAFDASLGTNCHFLKKIENIPYWYIMASMHVITKSTLVLFWKKHPDAERPLQAWFRTIESNLFIDFNGLRDTLASADYIDGLTVFNIGGNKYRLITLIHYNRRKVFIRAALTHSDYDRGHWKQRK